MRIKTMAKVEFSEVQDRNWIPVELTGDAVPSCLSGIPRSVAYRFLASARSRFPRTPISDDGFKGVVTIAADALGDGHGCGLIRL